MKHATEDRQNFRHNGQMEDTGSGISLAGLAVDPQLVFELRREQIPQILTDIASLVLAVATHLGSLPLTNPKPNADHLLTVEQAAQQLAVSKDFLYRNAKSLPFAIRLGRTLRFSAIGIERYLRRHVAKP
jgi:excisionase family DNA binding protein